MKKPVHCRKAAWFITTSLISVPEIQEAFFRQSANIRAKSSTWSRTKVRRFVKRHFTVSDSALPEAELRKLVRHFNKTAKHPPLEGTAAIFEAIAA